MKKNTLFLGIAILGLSFCTPQPTKPTLGLVVSTLNNPFFVSLRDGATTKAKELGYELVTLDSQNDVAKELANVEDLVSRKVSAILINPVDSDTSAKAAQKAVDAKIPVISLDRAINGVDISTHVASDNIAGGALAGEFITKNVPAGSKIIELQGIPGTSAARDRGKGFNDVIAKTSLKISAVQPADFDRAKGLVVTESLLQAYGDVVAIFAHNDEMALGAIKAVEGAKKNIIIVGFDATPDALAAVKEGKLSATVAQQPDQIGVLGVEKAVALATGESVEIYIPVSLTLVTQ